MALSEDEKAELVAYLDGELDEAATQAVEAKVATDPDARAELDALKQTWGMLDYLPKASPSANFTHRTLERLTLENIGDKATKPIPVASPARPWLARVGWAAAIVLALVGGYLVTLKFKPDQTPDPIPDADVPLLRHLRIAEKWRYYENVDDVDFARKLNHPDLFGEDPS
jgi:anti-sigma factor RsiW